MLYRREIEVARPPADAFAYLVDFARVSEWDPGVVESRRLGPPGPTEVGSRFEVHVRFRGGAPQPFEYVVTALEDGRRIELVGEGARATSRDVIVVDPAGDGARIAYTAEVRLKSVLRVAEPFLRGAFRRTGDEAIDGLAARLSTP